MAVADKQGGRLVSLDLLRGLTVIGMIVVNSAAYLESLGGYPAYPVLLHSALAGASETAIDTPTMTIKAGNTASAAV